MNAEASTGRLSTERAGGVFVTTRWSVVMTARDKSSPDSGEALETLCRTYWYPLYAFVRGSGRSPQDAQDLTQEFFARLLAKEYLRGVEPEKGRFRTFLRMAMKRFLANEWDRVSAQKRGGGQTPVAFDTTIGEMYYRQEDSATLAADSLRNRSPRIFRSLKSWNASDATEWAWSIRRGKKA